MKINVSDLQTKHTDLFFKSVLIFMHQVDRRAYAERDQPEKINYKENVCNQKNKSQMQKDLKTNSKDM